MTTLQDLVAEWRKEAEECRAMSSHGSPQAWIGIAIAYDKCANQLEAVLREEEEK